MTDGWGSSCKIALRWMPLDLPYDKSTLVQVMAWCRQTTSHCLSQCWPGFISPHGVTRPQWVKIVITPFCIVMRQLYNDFCRHIHGQLRLPYIIGPAFEGLIYVISWSTGSFNTWFMMTKCICVLRYFIVMIHNTSLIYIWSSRHPMSF